MVNFQKKESKVLSKINESIDSINTDMDAINTSDDIELIYSEQQDAIENISYILENENKLGKLEDKESAQEEKSIDAWASSEVRILNKINKKMNDLEKQLYLLTGNANKVKRFIAQKKAIRDIKNILHDASLFFDL
ncbi:hypothetical protein ACQ3MN_07895 [Enterococcus faecalis]|uniref:hypothetical protein n=1 Tax=Enterococcus faecalis TaxID=1351 RepID=UPI003D76E335